MSAFHNAVVWLSVIDTYRINFSTELLDGNNFDARPARSDKKASYQRGEEIMG
jgi:hypothetical protein